MRNLRTGLPGINYANVAATIAVVLTLGGTAYATHTHRIATQDLKNGAVTREKLAEPLRPLWASVDAEGVLLNGRGVKSTRYLEGTGSYEVVFGRSIVDCALIVTPRLPGSESVERIGASPYPSAEDPGTVHVRARHIQDGGWNKEHGFYLAAFC